MDLTSGLECTLKCIFLFKKLRESHSCVLQAAGAPSRNLSYTILHFMVSLNGNIRDGFIESIESCGCLDHAELQVVHFLLAEVGVCVGLVERRGKVLGAPQSRYRSIHLSDI